MKILETIKVYFYLRFGVYSWQVVTVALFQLSNSATVPPTTTLRPITTALLP
jgi:hypothetical protein